MHNTKLTQWEFIIYIWFIFHWLAMSHCCYNPIIYCYMNARFRIGFLQILYFVPGIRRCCCINAYTRDRSTSLRTGIALTGKFLLIFQWLHILHISKHTHMHRKCNNKKQMRFYHEMSSYVCNMKMKFSVISSVSKMFCISVNLGIFYTHRHTERAIHKF